MKLIKTHHARVPIHWILFQNERVIGFPGLHLKGSASNDVLGLSPTIAILFDCPLRNETKELMGNQPAKERRRLGQRNTQLILINCFYADVFGCYSYKLFPCCCFF